MSNSLTRKENRGKRDEDLPKKDRPRPSNKNTTAHFPETIDNGVGGEIAISCIHVGMAWIFGQVAARCRSGQALIALMAGQEGLWETMQLHLTFSARTVPILDILHALAYVWEATSLLERDEPKRRASTRDRFRLLKRICRYLAKNASRMRYGEYLRGGYSIASGVIEGACRHLVKDRMERSGMLWALEGARSVLNIRAVFQSDHWRNYLDRRVENNAFRLR